MYGRLLLIFALLLSAFPLRAETTAAFSTPSKTEPKQERIYVGIGFGVDFDNAEFTGSGLGESQTLFRVALMPTLCYEWNDKHTIGVGANMQKNFGSKKFVDSIDLIAYYHYNASKYSVWAGCFGRNSLIGGYSRAFFTNAYLATKSVVQGTAFQYRNGKNLFEFAIDWDGLYSEATREKFRIMAAGEGSFARVMYAGAALSVQHYANKSIFEGNVVDNILVNPYIGVRFKAFFDFDIRLSYLQSLQRDRQSDAGWLTPQGGELDVRFSRWGVFIENSLYFGGNLMPLYYTAGKDGLMYGDDLYTGDPFYGTTHDIYNRTSIGYISPLRLWHDRIGIKAQVDLMYDGTRLYTQQMISLSVNIAPTIYDKQRYQSRKR